MSCVSREPCLHAGMTRSFRQRAEVTRQRRNCSRCAGFEGTYTMSFQLILRALPFVVLNEDLHRREHR